MSQSSESIFSQIPPDLRKRLRRRSLRWFARRRRDLPWRGTRDPYAIWVSEVMLQQTQVATVIGYFRPFLSRFPTVVALAKARVQDVLRQWEGLGYYQRARNLHMAARAIVKTHKGQFPRDPLILRRLPGLGRYTVGAILSQAFDRRLPILEANSTRLLSRLFGLKTDPTRNQTRQWLWRAAEVLLPRRQIGDFNQALMELGALVCTPFAPRCPQCPLAQDCQANQDGLQDRIPIRAESRTVKPFRELAVVVRRGPRVFVVQRPEVGLWAGLWEFPHGPAAGGANDNLDASRLLCQLTGIEADLGRRLAAIRHSVTNRRITLICFEARYRAGRFRSDVYQKGTWCRPEDLQCLPFSAPQRRLAQMVLTDT